MSEFLGPVYYYGKPSAPDMQTIDPVKTAVWDDNYKGVWHMNQVSSPELDSTSNGNSATTSAGSPTFGSAGQIGAAASFNSAALSTAAVVTDVTNNFTMTLWVKPLSTIYNGGRIFYDGDANSNGWGLISAGGSTQWGAYYRAQGGANFGKLVFSTWQMLTLVRRSGISYGYVNGVEYSLGGLAAPGTPTTGTFFGSGSSPIGTIDEVRISSVARSADWIKTEYNNQFAPATFYAISASNASSRPADKPLIKSRSGVKFR